MPRFDATNAEVFVYSFKEGLLSPVAHDLKIKVERFEIEVAGDAVTATFDAASLKVVCVRKDGKDASSLLPAAAFSEIERNISKEVLKAARFPQVRFVSTAVTDTKVEGELTLCGVTATVSGRRVDDASHWGAQFDLNQTRFGIRPYSAMLGTLKVKPQVTVVVRLPRS